VYAEVKAFVSGRDGSLFIFAPKRGNSSIEDKGGTMMRIDPREIQQLRTQTGAGVMDCKRALEESPGDFTKARAMLADKAEKTAERKANREVKAGVVDSYIHGNGRIGVLIQVDCETDFLSETAEFRALVKELALQIASESPRYVSAQDVPAEVTAEVQREAEANAVALGKPERAVLQIKEGKVRKFLSQVCLMEQRFIKNQDVTCGGLVQELIAKSGENIQVRRFMRYQLTE
jgi:elongation factor Ts